MSWGTVLGLTAIFILLTVTGGCFPLRGPCEPFPMGINCLFK